MLPVVKDILFATDLSENADNALRHALSMARACGAKVHVLHVVEPLSRDAEVTLQMFMQDETVRTNAIAERHKASKAALTENQKQFAKGLAGDDKDAYALVDSVELSQGQPAEEILKRSAKLGCNMIILGSHEHGTDHTFLGTVAKRVLRRSSVPVTVVPNIQN